MHKQRPYYEPFDPEYTREIIARVLGPIIGDYFRPRLLGAQRIPAKGPLILAPNHSGNAFPYDGIVLDALLWRRHGMRIDTKFRSLFEKELAQAWWMRPFGLDNFWRRCGGVDATFDNFDRLLGRGQRVIYYPEGVGGIGKGFRNRYKLQPFHTSFILLAARHDVPVCPAYIINAEWVIPFSFTLRPVDRLMQKLFHVPFLPLPAAPLAMVFPWAWWLTLPARMIFVIGEPLDLRAMALEEKVDLERPEPSRIQRVAQRVRADMQRGLDRYVARYGRWPYQLRSLRRALREARDQRRLAGTLPTAWTARFVRFARDAARPPARNGWHGLARDWDLIGYYLPFGWPLLSIARAARRPPYGYRGMDPEQRKRVEGRFVWRLEDDPLPPLDRSAS